MKIDKAESGRKKETKNTGGNARNGGGATVIIFWDFKCSEKIRLEISEDGTDIRTPLLTLTFKMVFPLLHLWAWDAGVVLNLSVSVGPSLQFLQWYFQVVFFPLIYEKSILSHSLVKILRWEYFCSFSADRICHAPRQPHPRDGILLHVDPWTLFNSNRLSPNLLPQSHCLVHSSAPSLIYVLLASETALTKAALT